LHLQISCARHTYVRAAVNPVGDATQTRSHQTSIKATRWPQRDSNPCSVAVTFSPAVSRASHHDASGKPTRLKHEGRRASQTGRWLKSRAHNHFPANYRSVGFRFEIWA